MGLGIGHGSVLVTMPALYQRKVALVRGALTVSDTCCSRAYLRALRFRRALHVPHPLIAHHITGKLRLDLVRHALAAAVSRSKPEISHDYLNCAVNLGLPLP